MSLKPVGSGMAVSNELAKVMTGKMVGILDIKLSKATSDLFCKAGDI